MTSTMRSSTGVYALQEMTSYLKQEIPGGFCFLRFFPITVGLCLLLALGEGVREYH